MPETDRVAEHPFDHTITPSLAECIRHVVDTLQKVGIEADAEFCLVYKIERFCDVYRPSCVTVPRAHLLLGCRAISPMLR